VSAAEHDSADVDLHGDRTTIGLDVPPLDSLPVAFVRGTRIGRYVALGDVGSGGMGRVVRARDPELQREVALKLLRTQSSSARARLIREAQAMARLSDPNVLPVYDVAEHAGMLFIAMEYVEGRTLRAWLRERPRGRDEIIACFCAAGRGLAAAHEAGIVHRDFKPDNVLIGDDGRVRVMDFGLARTAEERDGTPQSEESALASPPSSESLTEAGTVMGTPAYMAPEQHSGAAIDARTDQYGFCVALYEALFGVRPFRAATTAELSRQKARGDPVIPTTISVPRQIRAVVMRGLDPDRAQRFASMPDLLAELARPRSTMRWRIVAATSAAATLAAITAAAASHRSELCRGADQALAGIWNDARADAIDAALVESGEPYARDTAIRVRQGIDEYVAAWASAHTDACETTQVRGEQSALVMDARMRCLDGSRRQLRAVIDVLADADASTPAHATQAVAGLPRLERCSDIAALAAQVPPPEPADEPAALAIRERLADARALDLAGRHVDGLLLCDPLLREAEALGYRPLVAEVAFRKGWLEEHAGSFAAAEESLRSAFFAARESGMDELAADAASALVVVVGVDLARHEDGVAWAERARAEAEHLADDTTKAGVCSNVGHFDFARGAYDEALEQHQCALALKEEVLGSDAPDVATSLHNLGSVQAARGKYDDALAYHERALAISKDAFGAEHPAVGESENSLGGLHYARGAYVDAAAHFARAFAIWDEALGSDHPDVAAVLGNLGAVENELGNHAKAIEYQKRALAIRERTLGDEHPDVGTSLNNLGAVLRAQGSLDESLAHFERALEIWERAWGPEHPDVAITHGNLAKVHLLRGDAARALAHARRALAINEGALGPDHPDLGRSLTTIGQSLIALDRPVEAIAALERALAVRSTSAVDSIRVAETRFALARALRDAGRDRARARELAEAALASYRGAGERTAAESRDVSAWLRR